MHMMTCQVLVLGQNTRGVTAARPSALTCTACTATAPVDIAAAHAWVGPAGPLFTVARVDMPCFPSHHLESHRPAAPRQGLTLGACPLSHLPRSEDEWEDSVGPNLPGAVVCCRAPI